MLAAGAVAAPSGAAELGVVRTGAPAERGIFDGPIRDLAGRAGIGDLLPRVEAWLAAAPDEAERLEWGGRVLVADWSGDGRPDDLSLHYMFVLDPDGVRTTTTLRAIEGDSGKLLWSRRLVRDNDTYVVPLDQKVGPRGTNGLLLVEMAGVAFGSTGIDYTFRALTGTGKKLWTYEHSSTMVGDWPVTFAGADYVTGMGGFDALPGRATDMLLGSGTVVSPPDWRLRSGVIEAAVIDGSDGTLVTHPVPEVGVGFVPQAMAMRDFDADGRDDYVFVNRRESVGPGEDGAPLPLTVGDGLVTARKGTDGAPLWNAGGLDFTDRNVQLSDIGHVVGSKSGDVFVETQYQGIGEKNADQYLTYLLDGDAGRVVWRRRGQWPYSPGDVDGDGSKDVLLQHFYGVDGYVATHVRAYTDQGRLLWQREYRTEHPLQTCCSWLIHFDGGWGVGDFDGDRLSDGYIEHSAGPFGPRRDVDTVEHFVIDASSGAVLASGGRELYPLGSSADGGTADYADIRWDAGGLTVEVHDGATAEVLTASEVEFDLPIDPKNLYLEPEAARLTADRCGDVLLLVEAATGTYELALDGADGSLLWGHSIGRRNGVVRLAGSTDSNEAC
jgi:hypothetical protein